MSFLFFFFCFLLLFSVRLVKRLKSEKAKCRGGGKKKRCLSSFSYVSGGVTFNGQRSVWGGGETPFISIQFFHLSIFSSFLSVSLIIITFFNTNFFRLIKEEKKSCCLIFCQQFFFFFLLSQLRNRDLGKREQKKKKNKKKKLNVTVLLTDKIESLKN